MEPTSQPRFSVGQVCVTLVIGSVALLMLGLQPILLGELEAKQLITGEGVGIVAMGEILALGIGVALSDVLLPVSRHRLITAIAALVAAALDTATLRASGDAGFVALRSASGLAEGVLVWSTTCVIVRSANPEQLAAVFMVVQTVAQAGAAALLAGVVVPEAGWQGGFGLLAVLTGLCAVLAAWLPPKLIPLHSESVGKLRWTVSAVLPLIIPFLQMAALGAVWAYQELLGKAVGLDDQGARFITPEVLVMQVVGGVAATWAVRRFAPVPALATGNAVLAAVTVGIHLLPAGAVLPYTLLCAVFGFLWMFLMPFHIALAFRADAKGRVAVLVPAAQLIGSAAGPFAASLTVSGDDVHTVPLVSLGFALGAAALAAAGWRLWVKMDEPGVKVLPALKARDDTEPAY
jgi:hypothetical protein